MIKNKTNEIIILHQKALEIAGRFRKCEFELLEILQKMDQKKGFIQLGYSSLFVYAVEALKLSEANASNFIAVARKAREIPALKSEIEKGTITVSKARKITPVLNKENQTQWLQKASSLPTRKLEQEVAKVAPETAVRERAKYVAENRLELKIGVSEALMKKLRRAQDLVSNSLRKPARLEETLEQILNLYLEKKDPVQKAKRVSAKQKIKSNRVSRDTELGTNRKPIPAPVQHTVHQRDQGKCQFKLPDDSMCGQSRWTHFHHVKPVSMGGENTVKNLIKLCTNHHKHVHETLGHVEKVSFRTQKGEKSRRDLSLPASLFELRRTSRSR